STHHTQADEREPTLRYTRSGVRGQIKSAPLEGPSNLLNIVEMALVDVISAKERSQSKRHSLASAPHQRQPKNTQEKQNRNTKIPVMWLDGKEATIPKAPQKNTTPPNPTHKVESESAPQQPKQSPSQSQDTKEPTPNVIENNHEDNHEENAKAVVEPTQWAALILFAFAMVVGGIALLRLIIS
ncbi:MAG: hypothetical protein NZM37_09200, partial [Sandaracinaceae bacterium]|nr:hypothetical protein [Sandaracinaceae bacterium]